MTEEELALALVEQGRLTPDQVREAEHLSGTGRNFAQVVVEKGWMTAMEVLRVDASAFFPVAQCEPPPYVPTPDPSTSFFDSLPNTATQTEVHKSSTVTAWEPPGETEPVPPIYAPTPVGAATQPLAANARPPLVRVGSGKIDLYVAIQKSWDLFGARWAIWNCGRLHLHGDHICDCDSSAQWKQGNRKCRSTQDNLRCLDRHVGRILFTGRYVSHGAQANQR